MNPSQRVVAEITKRITAGCRLPMVVGVQGIQGSGKSTMCAEVKENLTSQKGVRSIVLSIDDFYMRSADLRKLYENTRNELWNGRGLPGTHDIFLLDICLEKLRSCVRAPVDITRYDKRKHGGKGDRADSPDWVRGPVDVILVEGWFVGFTAVPTSALEPAYNKSATLQTCKLEHLMQINSALFEYEHIWKTFDLLILMVAPSASSAYEWRWEQELEMKKRNGVDAGMTQDEVNLFVDRFMYCYELYLTPLLNGPPVSDCIKIYIDAHHKLLSE